MERSDDSDLTSVELSVSSEPVSPNQTNTQTPSVTVQSDHAPHQMDPMTFSLTASREDVNVPKGQNHKQGSGNMELNNWMQGHYHTTKYLTTETSHIGPDHAGYWVAIVYCMYSPIVTFSLFGTDHLFTVK